MGEALNQLKHDLMFQSTCVRHLLSAEIAGIFLFQVCDRVVSSLLVVAQVCCQVEAECHVTAALRATENDVMSHDNANWLIAPQQDTQSQALQLVIILSCDVKGSTQGQISVSCFQEPSKNELSTVI